MCWKISMTDWYGVEIKENEAQTIINNSLKERTQKKYSRPFEDSAS